MMISTTSQNKDLCIEIVRVYLDWIVKKYPTADEVFISELLRYTLCSILGLESLGSTLTVMEVELECSKVIKPILVKSEILNQSRDYKQGFLEACVHCVEFARKRCKI